MKRWVAARRRLSVQRNRGKSDSLHDSAMKFWTLDLPLRPLLFATGAAATAVGVCFLIKKNRDLVLQKGFGDVCALEPGSKGNTDEIRDAQKDSAIPEQKVLEQMETLLGLVQELKEEISEISRTCEQMKKERQQEQEAHSILMGECDQMREALKSQDELLKVSQDEANMKYQEALDTRVHLELKIFGLEAEMDKVNNYSQQLAEDYSACHRMHKKEQWDQEILQAVHQNLVLDYNAMETNLSQEIDFQMATVSQFERKIEQTRESVVQLHKCIVDMDIERVLMGNVIQQTQEHLILVQKKNNRLIKEGQDKDHRLDKRNCFHNAMQNIMSKAAKAKSEFHTKFLFEHNVLKEQHSELLKEYEQEHKAYDVLKSQYEHLMKQSTFDQNSLANSEDMKRKLRLEKRNSELRNQAKKLEAMVLELKRTVRDSYATCEVIKEDIECAQESFHMLQSQCVDTIKQHDELLLEMKKERLAHSTLKMRYSEMMEALKQCTDSVNMDHINQELEKIPAGGGV